MHRMVLALSMLLVGTHAHAQSQQSAASSTKAASLPTDELSDDLGETPESIAALPWIVGDRESTRREWIKKAYDLRADKTAGDEASRKHQIDEYLRAADSIRSSTFTRCNLGLLAHERGDVVSSPQYFRRETSQPLREGATSREKFIRHVCETYAALAKQRVGELNIKAPEHSTVWINHHYVGAAPLLGTVFVKPNEEQNVKVKLADRSELRETVAVRPGESTTLEFYSPEKEKELTLPKVSVSVPREGMMLPAPEEKWRERMLWGSMALTGAGLGILIGSSIFRAVTNGKLETTRGDAPEVCSRLPTNDKNCFMIHGDIRTADLLGYLSAGILGVGVTGITVYFVYPQSPSTGSTSSKNQILQASLPGGLGFQGTF